MFPFIFKIHYIHSYTGLHKNFIYYNFVAQFWDLISNKQQVVLYHIRVKSCNEIILPTFPFIVDHFLLIEICVALVSTVAKDSLSPSL